MSKGPNSQENFGNRNSNLASVLRSITDNLAACLDLEMDASKRWSSSRNENDWIPFL